jgi:hypothetical protein
MYLQEDYKKFLCGHWEKVVELSFKEDLELFYSFIQDCVVEEYRKKFISEFDLNVKERDFDKYRKFSLDDSFTDIFEQEIQFPLSAEITWGEYSAQRRAFRVKGRAAKARDLFFDYECDAIARIHLHKRMEYLFCSETMGLLHIPVHPKDAF